MASWPLKGVLFWTCNNSLVRMQTAYWQFDIHKEIQELVEPGDVSRIGLGHKSIPLVTVSVLLNETDLQSVLFISIILSELCPGKCSKGKNKQSALTSCSLNLEVKVILWII
jgi:hypothetical protein